MKTLSATLFICALGPALVSAAPANITVRSGIIANGNSVVISGANLGTHADEHTHNSGQIVWKWHNFEAGLEDDGFHLRSADYLRFWERTTSGGRSGYWAKRFSNGTGTNVQGLMTDNTPFVGNTFFMSYWSYVPTNPYFTGKTMRITWSGHNSPDGFSYCFTNLGNGAFSTYGIQPPAAYIQNVAWSALDSYPKGEWVRIDMLLTGDVPDPKSQKIWFVGKNGNSPVMDRNYDEIAIYESTAVNVGAGVSDESVDSSAFFGYDDIYASFTQARVELCAEAVWSEREHCEIQIPSAWSNTEITFTVNQGTFNSGDNAYLYVVDAGGLVNTAGAQVSVGTCADGGVADAVVGQDGGLTGNDVVATDATTSDRSIADAADQDLSTVVDANTADLSIADNTLDDARLADTSTSDTAQGQTDVGAAVDVGTDSDTSTSEVVGDGCNCRVLRQGSPFKGSVALLLLLLWRRRLKAVPTNKRG